MKRIVADLLIVLLLTAGSSSRLLAQSLTADRFLAGVSARPVGDQVEQDQFLKADMALNAAPPAEVQRELPSILQYALSGNEVHVREYAVGFLTAIAIRPDGANLLSSDSEGISSLLVDSSPGIQNGAAAITDWLIGKPGTNNQPYISAMQAAIQKPQTPQLAGVNMVIPLLKLAPAHSGAVASVLEFMHRKDLTVWTRTELVHEMGVEPGLPEEVTQTLVKDLDDPDPWVRAAAVAAFSDSTTEYRTLAKNRIERMATDPQEDPDVRELAKEAIAGKTNLSPNIHLAPEPKDLPPLPPVQPMDH